MSNVTQCFICLHFVSSWRYGDNWKDYFDWVENEGEVGDLFTGVNIVLLFNSYINLKIKHITYVMENCKKNWKFNPDLTGRLNAKCNVIPLTLAAALPVDAVTRTDGLSKLWLGYLRIALKYSVIAVTKKLFLTLPLLKIIWKGFGSNSLFFSANLQYTMSHYKFKRMLLNFI